MRRWLPVLAALTAAIVASPSRVDAQSLSRASLDSVAAVDLFRGDGTTGNPGTSVDISSTVRLRPGWSLHLRPWFFRSSADNASWSRELYQAAVRYERSGLGSMRVDAGFIPSPIGLGMLDMRADVNPTIMGHPSYFTPLPLFDTAAPAVRAISATYPLGASATISRTHWDARVAAVTTSPARRYAFNGVRNARTSPVAIVGGGLTIVPGFRVGASFADGRYASADELPSADSSDRNLRMWTAEVEYARGYTKLAGEWTRERFMRDDAATTASPWFVQGLQTMTPRWFAAARLEQIDAPAAARAATASRQTYRVGELTAGYRLTPELTLRTSLALVRRYGSSDNERRVGVQAVWSRRWW